MPESKAAKLAGDRKYGGVKIYNFLSALILSDYGQLKQFKLTFRPLNFAQARNSNISSLLLTKLYSKPREKV